MAIVEAIGVATNSCDCERALKNNVTKIIKIEKYMLLSITSSFFKLQKWQTPFWKAYDIRNNIK
jgi:hypothetical protein